MQEETEVPWHCPCFTFKPFHVAGEDLVTTVFLFQFDKLE